MFSYDNLFWRLLFLLMMSDWFSSCGWNVVVCLKYGLKLEVNIYFLNLHFTELTVVNKAKRHKTILALVHVKVFIFYFHYPREVFCIVINLTYFLVRIYASKRAVLVSMYND